jgi:Asp-tRNA(Asn)/Glu-tRNA(Gln) amidotransferase A subunit family amidase
MAFEANRELAHERLRAPDMLSTTLRRFLNDGAGISLSARSLALSLRDECLASLDTLFGDADILVLPSAPDIAPPIESGTGDPVMSRAWTLLGLPSVSIPMPRDQGSLPLGLQIAARPMMDRELLSIATWIEREMSA